MVAKPTFFERTSLGNNLNGGSILVKLERGGKLVNFIEFYSIITCHGGALKSEVDVDQERKNLENV